MESPIRTPWEVAQHLADLRGTHGRMVGEYDRRRTLLEFELHELTSLRERHAAGQQLPPEEGRAALHIADVLVRQAARHEELHDLRVSHKGDLQELAQSIVRFERLERYHREGLDIVRLQYAEAVLEVTGGVQGSESRELLESLMLDLAKHADTPAAAELARHQVGLWSGGYPAIPEPPTWKEHAYGKEVGQGWELLLGVAPEYRVNPAGAEVPGLPLDACIYYLSLLQSGRIQTLARALADGAPAYDDPFQDE